MVVKRWPASILLCLSIAGSASAGVAAGGPRVTYDGPTGNVTGPLTLTAEAKGNGARIAAVTFVVDGAPRGSDTTAPYSLGLNPALVRGGRHTVRVVAVDNLGRRASTSVANIVTSGGDRPVMASPQAGLAEALRALRSGDVTVRLAPGRYRLDNVVLGTSARLVGSGPRTVISPSKAGYFAILVAKGEHVRIANLTVDGGGAGPGGGNAIAVFDGSRDVRLQRLRLRHVRQNGVNVWGAYSEVSVQDSVIDGGGTGNAGIFSLGSDKSRNTSVIRTRIHGFRTFGILFGQKNYGRTSAALHDLALDNVISDIRDPARNACYKTASAPRCGTEEGGIWTGGVEAAIIGNTIVRARWDGIETVGSSTRTTIADNVVRATRTGIYLEHATNEQAHDLGLVPEMSDSRGRVNHVAFWLDQKVDVLRALRPIPTDQVPQFAVRGQNVKAFVILKPGYIPNDELKVSIINNCREHVAIYKLPRAVEFVKELPRTLQGKLLRRVLRDKEPIV